MKVSKKMARVAELLQGLCIVSMFIIGLLADNACIELVFIALGILGVVIPTRVILNIYEDELIEKQVEKETRAYERKLRFERACGVLRDIS